MICGLVVALGAAAFAGGCTAVSTGASVVSLMATKKTLTDHVVSFATDMDCSTIALERGGSYCSDPDAAPPPQPLHHCYRSLGEITCYEAEDPFNNGHVAVR